MAGRRKALILVIPRGQDDKTEQLLSVGAGSETLEKALKNPNIGGFEVSVLESRFLAEVKAAVEAFFNDCDPEDVLLLYLACQGIPGLDGKMYFATADTDVRYLISTALSANFINDAARSSLSMKKFLLLDCSLLPTSADGRAAQMGAAKSAAAVCSVDQFSAPGMGVMMAFNPMPFPSGQGSSCRQTLAQCLAEGMNSGAADVDGDGLGTFQDLCDHFSIAGLMGSVRQPEAWGSSNLLTMVPLVRSPRAPRAGPSSMVPKAAPAAPRRCRICDAECGIRARFCTQCGNPLPVPSKVRDLAHSGDEAEERETPSFSRYPSIEAPEKAVYRRPFTFSVRLKVEPSQPEAEPMIVYDSPILRKDPGAVLPPPEVEVVVEASGFDIFGSWSKVLSVDREKDSTAEFTLLPLIPGERVIQVEFFQMGRRIGVVRRSVTVLEKGGDFKSSATKSSVALELEEFPAPPLFDLEIYINMSLKGNEEYTLSFRLLSLNLALSYHHARMGEVTLHGSPQEKMLWVYELMGKMASQSTADAEIDMRNLGMDLWDELISRELKEAYWHFRDKIRTLLMTSDEPWIPWEMLRPHRYREDLGREEIDPFLCQRFIMSRWLCGESCGAKDLSKGVALPVASLSDDLPSARAEVDFIENLSKLDPEIRPKETFEDKSELLATLEGSSFSILHFAAHCGFDSGQPNSSAIKLSRGTLRPSDIHTTFDGRRRPRPLVFINACKGARMDFSFTGLGGWADRFINKANVGALIGAMWEVKDDLALEFARNFYTALLCENKTVAQAMKQAREAVRRRDPSNSTWLAYVLYADPEVRMRSKDQPAPMPKGGIVDE